MKFILVMYLCSTITNQCPTSSIPGYQFNSHYDCVYAGYAIAQRTYKNLLEYEEDFDIDRPQMIADLLGQLSTIQMEARRAGQLHVALGAINTAAKLTSLCS